MQVIQSKNELIKHSAAVHINNKLTLVERKVSNILLNRALRYMEKVDEHEISIKDLCVDLQIPGNKNYEMIKNALRALSQTQMEWNILNKDKKNKWGVSSIIASVEIENGICKYSYSAALKKLFSNPNIYAKLNMAIQASFTSKYSIALWEYIMEFISSSSYQRADIIKTQISVADIRKLLGVEDSKYYLEFSNFNREILKKAVKEINEISDLEVEINFIKQNKKVVAIEILVKRVSSHHDKIGILSIDASSPFSQTNTEKTELIETLTTEFSFTEAMAENLINEYDFERIRLVIDYTRNHDPANPVGYIKKALKEQWKLFNQSNVSIIKSEETKKTNFDHINSLEDDSLKQILFTLHERFGESLFKSWFKDFYSIRQVEEGKISITLSNYTTFKADYLKSNYSLHILNLCKDYYGSVSSLIFSQLEN